MVAGAPVSSMNGNVAPSFRRSVIKSTPPRPAVLLKLASGGSGGRSMERGGWIDSCVAQEHKIIVQIAATIAQIILMEQDIP